MKREELKSAFINAVRKNDLYDGEAITIPNEIGRKFMDDFYSEMISSEECKARKRYYFNYAKKVMHEKDWYVNEITILEFINEHIHDESDFDDALKPRRFSFCMRKQNEFCFRMQNETFGPLGPRQIHWKEICENLWKSVDK